MYILYTRIFILDIPEQLLGGERDLDIEEDLDGSEHSKTPERNRYIEVLVDITPTIILPDTSSNLPRGSRNIQLCLESNSSAVYIQM